MTGINLSHIWKQFLVERRPLPVLVDLNLFVPEQKITVLLGKSGCGKTTILRIVGRLEQADGGEISHGESLRTAFVFQEPRLMPWLSVYDNVSFGLRKDEIRKSAIDAQIALVGLSGFARAFPDQLSGGMQQRVAIARALAYGSDFIMMDEPFAALDYFTRAQMQKELIRVQTSQRSGILFVTHSIDEALVLADKIAVIEGGKVKCEFSVPEEKGSRNLLAQSFLDLRLDIMRQLENT